MNTKNLTRAAYLYCSIFMSILLMGCKDEINDEFVNDMNLTTRSQIVPSFDWETIDWMPTPIGQAKIPAPWAGPGSITSVYGVDIVNDRKASDGWVLLYSTFDENSKSPLVNPYFILYNKYRGIMRIFFYTTTQFVSYSSFIKEGISINSSNGQGTSMLNFLGNSVVNVKKTV